MTVAGVPFFVHGALLWSLTLLWVFLYVAGYGSSSISWLLLCALVTMASVTLHEGGHALAARTLGVNVHDVILHVFFGMTRMDPPETPRQEALIGLAGPSANLLAAACLSPWGLDGSAWRHGSPDSVLAAAFVVNLAIGSLNLIPAFPMDGGRLLRCWLTGPLGEYHATRWAVGVGRTLAVMMILAPVALDFTRWSFGLPLVGMVVLCLGEAESQRASLRREASRVARFVEERDREPPQPSN